MKCATITAFGKLEDVLRFVDDFPKPVLKENSYQILLRVLACSTSPGDIRTLTGSVDLVRKPPVPYIPSQDVCGIVEQIGDKVTRFKVGDCVIGTWEFEAKGGMAEYAVINEKLAVLKPPNVNALEGAALANSAVNAMLAVRDAGVENGDRVLVIGGSSGVGTSVIQLVRDIGASFIASTSTDIDLLQSLGVDRAINYRNENWWDVSEFKSQPFDCIIDCAEGKNAWKMATSKKLLKRNGTFIGVVSDSHDFEIHTCPQMCGAFFCPMIGRPWWTWICCAFSPRYKMLFGAPRGDSLAELMQLVQQGKVKAVLDPKSPFSFDQEGVLAAFQLQASRRAHGKIVVQTAPEEELNRV